MGLSDDEFLELNKGAKIRVPGKDFLLDRPLREGEVIEKNVRADPPYITVKLSDGGSRQFSIDFAPYIEKV
jgi:hypothetical protein